jgi:hypothetical protein
MKKREYFNGFTLLVAVLCLLTLALNMINGRFHLGDFMVYYTAAQKLAAGEQVYLVSFYTGSGIYKYSPATLWFFLPYTLFSFRVAAIIHFILLGTAYWYTFLTLQRLIRTYFPLKQLKHETWLISLAFVGILIHFVRETYLGNINIFLLLLCCLAIRNFLRGKRLQGGILLGIALLTKPYLLILLLPLVLRRQWRAAGWTMAAVAGGLLLPFLYPGPEKSMVMYRDWINTILLHSNDFPGMTSMHYFLQKWVPFWPAWGEAAVFMLICGGIILFILMNLRLEKKMANATMITRLNFLFEWFVIIALLPNLIKTDWVLLLFSAPLITFMIYYIAASRQYLWIPWLVVLLFFFGANSDDLLGKNLSHNILHSGLMGLANFLTVATSFIMFVNLRKHAP